MKSQTNGLRIGLYIFGAVVGLYLIGGIVFDNDVRCHAGALTNTLPIPVQRFLCDIYNPLWVVIIKIGLGDIFFS